MINLTEAILSKKNISDIVNITEELFKRSFRSIYSNIQNYEYITNPKKYEYAIIKLNSLISTQDPKDIELNSYIINTEEWENNGLNKEIAFSSYAGDKRLETKYPITIIFEGDYIEGFTFIGGHIRFIIGSHQRVKDCNFSMVKRADFYFYNEFLKPSVMRTPTHHNVFNNGAFIATWMEGDDLVKDRTSQLLKIFDVRSIILPSNKTYHLGVSREGRSKYDSIATTHPDKQAIMDALKCDGRDLNLMYFH